MRVICLVLAISIPLAACAGGLRASPGKKAVDGVVLDETQRQEAAEAAQAGATASEALSTVSDGPKAQAPVP
ncbi:MAG: hypothetical protein ABW360_15045 [Phenylobacterium sp.]